MTDNLEVHSTASSEISESLREQILGKGYNRRKSNKPTKGTQSQEILRDYEVIPSKEQSVLSRRVHDVRSGGDNRNQESKDLSYHTPLTGSKIGESFEVISNTVVKEDSNFAIIPKHSSTRSMKSSDNHRYATIETQTVAIQTISSDPDWECRCCWEDNVCACCESEPYTGHYSYSKNKRGPIPSPPLPPEDTTDPDPSTFENFTDTSSQTEEVKKRHRNHCTCSCNCKCWQDYDLMSDQFSDSDDSYATDFLDLPYQNNEEYLKLLRELEKKLLARNRERVRRTMMEFERKSRQNQNLDKPVCDYSNGNATVLRKLAPRKHSNTRNKKSVCCKCGRNKRVDSDILQNEKRWDEINFVQSVIQSSDGNCQPAQNHFERSLHKSHWQLDPNSGEWVKVSAFQQTDFSRPPRGDHIKCEHPKMTPNGNFCKNDCCCRQRKRR